ncbi:MAG: UvrD-helicase domain-containing protein, partial [Oceanococcaceae bacterium]
MNKAFSRLIPASAGSGKTYTLTKLLERGILGAPWDAEKNPVKPSLPRPLRPEAVVAVTFTEAAAQELRQRVRGVLMQPDSLDAAQRLDEAYISTIHAFGLRLLRETAFDRGEVLSPRLLTEDEQEQLLRQTLGRTQQLQAITLDLTRFGYRYNGGNQQSAEDAFRARVLSVVNLLSSMPEGRNMDALRSGVRESVAAVYGKPSSRTPEQLAAPLVQRVRDLLSAHPRSLVDEGYANSGQARKAFQKDYDALRAAADQPERLLADWSLWKQLGELRLAKKRAPTPEGYDNHAQAILDYVEEVFRRHPGPLKDAQDHIDALLRGAQEVLTTYRAFKDDAGLFDYGDMVGEAVRALKDPTLRDRLTRGMDCVVIDEFQDTNPQQFALMWSLMKADLPAVMVGDVKQAIMGFQGADSRLFEALVDTHTDLVSPLRNNWRSQPRLMEVINAISGRLFEGYEPLGAMAEAASLDPLHVLVIPDETGTKSDKWRAKQVAAAIKAKLDDRDLQVFDRHTRQKRLLRGGDCAVLCPTHSMLETYADALKAQGVSVRLKSQDWLESTEVQLALEGLALLHDPADRHAQLYLSVSPLGEGALQEGVLALLDAGEIVNPVIAALADLSAEAACRSVEDIVPLALEQMGLYDAVMTWPNSRQARANLQRL